MGFGDRPDEPDRPLPAAVRFWFGFGFGFWFASVAIGFAFPVAGAVQFGDAHAIGHADAGADRFGVTDRFGVAHGFGIAECPRLSRPVGGAGDPVADRRRDGTLTARPGRPPGPGPRTRPA
jgi:hypothetical protein